MASVGPFRPRRLIVASLVTLTLTAAGVAALAAKWVAGQNGNPLGPGVVFFWILVGALVAISVWSAAWGRFGGIWIEEGAVIHRAWSGRKYTYALHNRRVRLTRTKTRWGLTLLLLPLSFADVDPVWRTEVPWDGRGYPRPRLQGLPDLDVNIYRLALPAFLRALQGSGAELDKTALRYLEVDA